MKTSFRGFLLCVIFTIGSAQPGLYREPFGCAALQRQQSTLAHAHSTAAVACILYCIKFIGPHLKKQPKPCYEVKPRTKTQERLVRKCNSSNRSVELEISNYRSRRKSNNRALIYLGVNESGSITAKSVVYLKTSNHPETNTCLRRAKCHSCKLFNRNICTAC